MKITKQKLKQIIKEELEAVSSHYTTNPELDQVADITADVVESGGQLMQIAVALKEQGFDASFTSGVLMVDNKYVVGKADKFEIGPDDEFTEVGEYIVGML